MFVRKSGKRFSFAGFLAQAKSKHNGLAIRRLGIKVTRRVGNAVVRNRMKRIFRELFRLHQNELPLQCDLVVVAHPGIPEMTYKRLQDDFLKLCKLIQSKVDPSSHG
jgi:ribonuclease P protein component